MEILTKTPTQIVIGDKVKTQTFTWKLKEDGHVILKIETRIIKNNKPPKLDVKKYQYTSLGQLYSVLLGRLDLRPSELTIIVSDGEREFEYSKLCLALGQPIQDK